MSHSKDEILRFLRASLPRFSQQYGVRRIAIFGSAARDEASPTSDLDVLVELHKPTFDHYMDLKFELEDHFGVAVDLVMEETLKERLRPVIEREAVYA